MTTSYQLIIEQDALTDFCRKISRCRWLAVDTEFVRKDTYFPKIGLIQVYAENGYAAIIDPVALENLNELWTLFHNPDIVKVFHAARQDLEVLYHVSGKLPQPIFDTQIAGIFFQLGVSSGLGTALEKTLSITLAKDQTRTDWLKRPLNEKQLQYAFDDVYYLAKLYRHFEQQLSEVQKQVLDEDFTALLSPSLYALEPHLAGLKIKPLQNLSPKQRAIGLRLAEWREAYAIDHDKPRRWTLGDDALIAMAKRPPKELKTLYKVPGMEVAAIKQFGDEWIALIDDVFAHPEHWPGKLNRSSPPLPQEETMILLGLTLVNHLSNQYNVPVSQITNRTQLLALIRDPFSSCLLGWRKYLFEQDFIALMHGSACLCSNDSTITVRYL